MRIFLATCILLTITATAFSLVPPYLASGEQLLRNGDFSSGLDGWETSKRADISLDDRTLTITSHSAKSRPSLWQNFPAPAPDSTFLVSGELSVNELFPGDKGWKRARLILYKKLPNSKREQTFPIVSLALDRDWQRYERVIAFGEKPHAFRLALEIVRASGTLRARDIRLQRAQKNPAYKVVYFSLLSAWIVLIIWIAHCFFRQENRPRMHPVFWTPLVVTAVLLLMPAAGKNALLAVVSNLLPYSLGTLTHSLGAPITPLHYVTEWLDAAKISHFFFFCLLAIVLKKAFENCRLWLFLTGLVLLCLSTESMQYFVPDRTPSLYDAGVDFAGMLLGLLLYQIGGFIVRRKR